MSYVEGSFITRKVGATAIPANRIVKLTAGLVVLATAATDNFIGTLQHAGAVGYSADVRLRTASGTSQVESGAAIPANSPITSDANGRAIVAATAGQQLLGYTIDQAATAAGQIIEFAPSTGKF